VILFWTLFGGGAAVCLWIVYRQRRLNPGLESDSKPPSVAKAKPVEVPLAVLQDANVLAAQGHFGEAAHVLLLQTVRHIGRRASIADSLTTREILARVPMPDSARDAFEELAGVVEPTVFGASEPDAATWKQCQEAYSRLLSAEGIIAR